MTAFSLPSLSRVSLSLPFHCLFTAFSLPSTCLVTAFSLPSPAFDCLSPPFHQLSPISQAVRGVPVWAHPHRRCTGNHPQHGLQPHEMARITSDCDAMLQPEHQNGPNHLGLRCDAPPEHQMALITSDCASQADRPGRAARMGVHGRTLSMQLLPSSSRALVPLPDPTCHPLSPLLHTSVPSPPRPVLPPKGGAGILS